MVHAIEESVLPGFKIEEETKKGATEGVFDEEVAFLLVDMRERLSPKPEDQIAHQEHIIIPSFGESLIAADNTARNRKLPSKFEVFESESPSAIRKRKTTLDAIIDGPYEPSPVNDEADEEAEWRNDELGSEEDDDEWMEGRVLGPNSPHITSYTSDGTPKSSRKKAPSGSACEKHKRWKKRCPDDCPMRKPKFRKRKAISDLTSQMIEGKRFATKTEQQPLIRSQSLPVVHSKDSLCTPTSDPDTPHTAPGSPGSASNTTTDYIALIRESMEQLKREFNYDNISDDIEQQIRDRVNIELSTAGANEIEQAFIRKRMREDDLKERKNAYPDSDGSDDSSMSELTGDEFTPVDSMQLDSAPVPKQKKSSSGKKSKSKSRSGRKYLPAACDRHKALHAKCPANCPDRIKRDLEQTVRPVEETKLPQTETQGNDISQTA